MDKNEVLKLLLPFTINVLRDAKAYTDESVTALLYGMRYCGAVDHFADLEDVEKEVGYAYTVLYKGTTGTEQDGTEYIWGEYNNTLQWIPLGPDISNKADKVQNGNTGNLVCLTADGNLQDSGKSPLDYYTSEDKGVPNGIAGLDSSGCVPPSQLPVSCNINDMELVIYTQNV